MIQNGRGVRAMVHFKARYTSSCHAYRNITVTSSFYYFLLELNYGESYLSRFWAF